VLPKLNALEAVSVHSVHGHSGVPVFSNFLDVEKCNVMWQSIIERPNHFSWRQGLPEFSFNPNNTSIQSDMHTGVGATGKNKVVLFIIRVEPFQTLEHPYQFALNSFDIRLNLTSVVSIT
jgi:hypothetical protein